MRSALAAGCLQVVLGCSVLSAFGCDADPAVEAAGDATPDAAADAVPGPVVEAAHDFDARRGCVVAAPAGVASLVAGAGGVVFAVPSGASDGPPLLLQRAHGEGCELTAEDRRIAAGELLDVDDLGNIYAYPAEAGATGAVSTMLPDESTNSMVAKIDAEDGVTKLLSAGRGIWSFGVAPGGDALWVTACGPTGIFTLTADGMTPAMAAPETLWEQEPSVLADGQTFWSVGLGRCLDSDALTPECGHALVRTTPAGSEEVAATIVDLGAGFERATLARCGANVCGLFASGVIVWGVDGEVLRKIMPVDALALPGESIAQVSGNDLGVYVLLRGEGDARVVFVPIA